MIEFLYCRFFPAQTSSGSGDWPDFPSGSGYWPPPPPPFPTDGSGNIVYEGKLCSLFSPSQKSKSQYLPNFPWGVGDILA